MTYKKQRVAVARKIKAATGIDFITSNKIAKLHVAGKLYDAFKKGLGDFVDHQVQHCDCGLTDCVDVTYNIIGPKKTIDIQDILN